MSSENSELEKLFKKCYPNISGDAVDLVSVEFLFRYHKKTVFTFSIRFLGNRCTTEPVAVHIYRNLI